MKLEIKSYGDDLLRGDFIYHNHELLRVTFVGKWRMKNGQNVRKYHFRRVGRVNLDRQVRFANEGKNL